MRESAAEFEQRDKWMRDWAGERDHADRRGPADVAYALEALGATPDGFARVLALVGDLRPGYTPAGLSGVAAGYRIGVTNDPRRCGGFPLGMYDGATVVAWTVSERLPG